MADLKVLMVPHLDQIHGRTNGINRVVDEYFTELPLLGIELVDPSAESYDVKIAHAGAKDNKGDWANVCMTHGLYWSSDHNAPRSEFKTNERVIQSARHAREVTVPSPWVAEAFQRDMRFTPHVIPHGIRVAEWTHSLECGKYVLWNKNRANVTCDPFAASELAMMFADVQFVSTFATEKPPPNISVTGVVPHDAMKTLVQRAGVYLSTTKETFGIGTLEAMAAGIPVLGWNHGGNIGLVQHGINGYLAQTYNYDDLADGLAYCMKNRRTLGANGRELARHFTWEAACKKLVEVFRLATQTHEPTVDIVIPCYNYADQVRRAIESACNQSYDRISSIIVVDDGSSDDGATEKVVNEISRADARVRYIRQNNSGVAIARNKGIAAGDARYIACLDADDAIEPNFIGRLVPVLEADDSLGIAYTGLRIITRNKRTGIGSWPEEFDYDKQLDGKNQVPTCCLFRREMWERLGGYRQRYAPDGAGTEDAEFWLRAGSIGYGAIKATEEPLFIYSMGTGHTSERGYKETNWLNWHPWVRDKMHPFASVAKPKFKSHPVRQYDEPLVSVVIPVAPWHTTSVIEALDSLEAQTLRKWEAILVDDTGLSTDCKNCDDSWLDTIRRAYPYLRVVTTPGEMGAGYSRNRGMELARAPLSIFLDADDFLKPEALERMILAYNEYKCAIYSDFEAHTDGVTDPSKLKNPVKFYDGRDGYAVISKKSLDYDWLRIQRGIEKPPYIWNLITTMFPTSWHKEIGGFDEKMPSWEDYDYWVRMAFAGKPFVRLPEELVVYLYHTGRRRHEGEAKSSELLQYMTEKYKDMAKRDCKGCGKSIRKPTSRSSVFNRSSANTTVVLDDDFVRCVYIHPNRGQHHVYGNAQFGEKMRIPDGLRINMVKHSMGGFKFYYGYIGGGQQVLVHRKDIQAGRYFKPVAPVVHREIVEIDAPPPPPAQELPAPEPISAPEPETVSVPSLEDIFIPDNGEPPHEISARADLELDDLPEYSYPELADALRDATLTGNVEEAKRIVRKMDEQMDDPAGEQIADAPDIDKSEEIPYNSRKIRDLQMLPGVSASVAQKLKDDGCETIDDILALGVEGLTAYNGIGEVRAEMIISAIEAL